MCVASGEGTTNTKGNNSSSKWQAIPSSARLLSFTYGMYLMTTKWSGLSPSLYRMGLLSTMSVMTLLLEISLERNCWGADRFRPSLLPGGFVEAIHKEATMC